MGVTTPLQTNRREGGSPLYQSIADHLTSSIQGGQYGEEALLPTLAELSDQFRVSQITVRHAVRLLVEQGLVATVPGKGTVVLARPRAAGEYSQERRAGLLAPFFPEWSALYMALPTVCHGLDLDLLVRPLRMEMDFSANREATLAELAFLRESCGQGLIVFGERFLTEAFLATRRPEEALVCLEDFNGVPDGIPLVTTDNFGGMFALTQHLIQQGHRRIAYLIRLRQDRPDDPRHSPGTTHHQRYSGYRDALELAGLVPAADADTRRALEGEEDAALAALRQRPNAPTAIVCDNAHTAHYLWGRLHRAGLRVPEDISLVGYDNILPPNDHPAAAGLTTMDHNFEEIARQAVRLLRAEKERLRAGRRAAPRILVPPTLIARASVGPPRI